MKLINKTEYSTTYQDEYNSENIYLKFTGDRYHYDSKILDTAVIGNVQFALTWENKEKFTKELEELIRRYQI